MSEIIIDGVKVEECSYYNKDNTPYCCEVWDNECEAQNCYYKQLKRLQAENERLKECINDIKQMAQSIADEEMINGYGAKAKCVLWKIINKIHQMDDEK